VIHYFVHKVGTPRAGCRFCFLRIVIRVNTLSEAISAIPNAATLQINGLTKLHFFFFFWDKLLFIEFWVKGIVLLPVGFCFEMFIIMYLCLKFYFYTWISSKKSFTFILLLPCSSAISIEILDIMLRLLLISHLMCLVAGQKSFIDLSQ
jgi:hypothetical protein